VNSDGIWEPVAWRAWGLLIELVFGPPRNRREAAMPRLIAVALVLVVCSGCASLGGRGTMFRGQAPGAGAPASVEPDLGAGTASPTPAPAFEGSTPNSSAAPQTFEEDGPTLSAPEARRQRLPARTAQLEAPRPKSSRPTGPDRSITNVAWSSYFRSTDRRPIDTAILGTGPQRIAILASMHGDQPQSVALVDLLAKHLKEHPELLEGRSILVIRNPNPDGLFARTPGNSRGVDLNRNFPAPNWKAVVDGVAGANAASEVETRTLMRVLLEFEPKLVVHVRDYARGNFVNVEGEAVAAAERLAEAIDGQVLTGLGQKTTGSLEAYAVAKLNSASVTALLGDAGSPESAWKEYGPGLLAALAAAPSADPARPVATTGAVGAEQATDDFDPDVSSGQSLQESDGLAEDKERITTRKRPRAPAILDEDADSIEHPSKQGPVPSRGYFELPDPEE
jgi:murein peptide amidase A